jgi:hypothetical protein
MSRIVIKPVSRERDNELIGWIRARARGQSAGSIAKAAGKNSGIIVGATNLVRDADIEESGEPEADVRGAYW